MRSENIWKRNKLWLLGDFIPNRIENTTANRHFDSWNSSGNFTFRIKFIAEKFTITNFQPSQSGLNVMQHFKTTSVKKTISTILFLFLTTFIYSQNSKTKIEENKFIEREKTNWVTDSLKNVIIHYIWFYWI
jgi:hypothetical protein